MSTNENPWLQEDIRRFAEQEVRHLPANKKSEVTYSLFDKYFYCLVRFCARMEKMQSVKFEIEKFNGSNNFDLWKVKMRDMLVQQGVARELAGKTKKPLDMSNEDWEEMDERALTAIHMCLDDDVLPLTLYLKLQQRVSGQSWKACT